VRRHRGNEQSGQHALGALEQNKSSGEIECRDLQIGQDERRHQGRRIRPRGRRKQLEQADPHDRHDDGDRVEQAPPLQTCFPEQQA
jgi:hypothetical protein